MSILELLIIAGLQVVFTILGFVLGRLSTIAPVTHPRISKTFKGLREGLIKGNLKENESVSFSSPAKKAHNEKFLEEIVNDA